MFEVIALGVLAGLGLLAVFDVFDSKDDQEDEAQGASIVATQDGEDIVGTEYDDFLTTELESISELTADLQGGSDWVALENASDSVIQTGGGPDDVYMPDGSNNLIETGTGADYVWVGGEDSVVRSGPGPDWVDASTSEGTDVYGGKGDDILFSSQPGTEGAVIKGWTGDDVLVMDLETNSEFGQIEATGGPGVDLFAVNLKMADAASDDAEPLVITDFEKGVDFLEVQGTTTVAENTDILWQYQETQIANDPNGTDTVVNLTYTSTAYGDPMTAVMTIRLEGVIDLDPSDIYVAAA